MAGKKQATPARDALAERVSGLVAEVVLLRRDLESLEARYRHHAERGDMNVQMHCDTALALRQVSGALEDLVRGTPR